MPGGVDDEQRYTPATRRAIRRQTRDRPGEELREGRRAAGDIATYQIGVAAFELGGPIA